MEICLVGLAGAGKTSLVNKISSGSFNEDEIPTQGCNMRKFSRGKVSIKLWEIGGQKRYRNMWERYCRGVSTIVYVVDAADGLNNARFELHELLSKKSLAEIPVLVLGNKVDLFNCKTITEFAEQMGLSALGEQREVAYYMISCKKSKNIDAVLNWLIQHSKSKAGK